MGMSEHSEAVFEFAEFRLDAESHLLTRDGEPVALMPKALDLLIVLVENRGRLIEKDELMQTVWPDSFVEEANLTVNVSALRRALGESPNDHRFIVTVPGRGYKFVADVRVTRGERAQEVVASSTANGSQTHRRSLLTPFLIAGLLVSVAAIIAGYFLLRQRESTGSNSIKSIAVLPFKPLIADRRDEALEMGIADTLIFKLSGVRGIEVRPIGAVRKYADISQDAVAAGREQQVDAVVDGSIQIDGESVRVIARLIRVADGAVIWTDKGEQDGARLFAVQDAIAEKLVSSLSLRLTDTEKERLTRRYTENAEAYRLYLLGRYLLNKRSADGYKKAIEYFQQALEKDPTYALAYTGLADGYTSLGSWQIIPAAEAFRKARDAAERALVLDDSLAEARTSLGLVKNYSADWRDAEPEFKRAIELNPSYDAAHRWYGAHLMGLGRLDEAMSETNRALELDPLSLPHNAQLGRIYYLMRDYDRAVEQHRKTLEIDPDFLIAHLQLGWTYEKKGMFDEAVEEYEKAIALQQQSDTGERVGGIGGIEARIGRAYALSGRKDEARQVLADLESPTRQGAVSPYNMALIYDGMGDSDMAMAYLEKAFDSGAQRFGLKTDPTWDGLRTTPRFQSLLERIEAGR